MASRAIYIDYGNKRITRYVEIGTTLVDLLQDEGILIATTCGGTGRCGTCKVKIKENLSQSRAGEQILTSAEKKEGYHLACQVAVNRALHIEIPDLEKEKLQVVEKSVDKELKLNPYIEKSFSSIINQTTITDFSGNIISKDQGDTTNRMYGIAFDIGSTSVVGYLIDLRTGQEMAVASRLNLQAQYGADVLSRISFATEKKNGLAILQKAVVKVLNEIIAEVVEKAKIETEDILDCTMVGNTTMQHLLLGVSPKSLGQAPHQPVIKNEVIQFAREIQINLPSALLRFLPSLGGFVGSDTLGVILTTQMYHQENLTLAVDIGTNGEMMLGNSERLIVCSSPAGPAFEGGQIRHGMRAVNGAIGKVWFDADLRYEVVGGTKPRGICGSGLVDLVAELIRIGVIDPSGRMKTKQECPPVVSYLIKKRLIEKETGNEFIIVEAEKSATGEEIVLTQQDVRELQLAKGAIYTGIQLLMDKLEVKPEQIHRFYLAGGFGSYIDPYNAKRIGLIPPIEDKKIETVGNAAGYGAKLALLSRDEWAKALQLSKQIEHYNLSEVEGYERAFVDSLNFPKTERW